MYDDEVLRRYYEPKPEDCEGIYVSPMQNPRAPMDICDKLIVTIAAAGFFAIFGSATYLAVAGQKYRKEKYEQQQHEYYQKWNRKVELRKPDFDAFKQEILRGR